LYYKYISIESGGSDCYGTLHPVASVPYGPWPSAQPARQRANPRSYGPPPLSQAMNKLRTRHGHISGVPHPIMEDTALKGDTRDPLHFASLPKRGGSTGKTLSVTGPSHPSREQVPFEREHNPFEDTNPFSANDGNPFRQDGRLLSQFDREEENF
jgi:hypothetical protein